MEAAAGHLHDRVRAVRRAAPDLWLVVARAGAVVAVAMVFKLCLRLTSELAGRPDRDAGVSRVALAYAPGVLAGIIAAIRLVFAGGFISDNALGYSEGLMTALALIAIERHLDGHHRQAFVIAFSARSTVRRSGCSGARTACGCGGGTRARASS